MGHKVHPKIYRIPFIHNWDSLWFARKKDLPKFLEQEVAIRELLEKKFREAGMDTISIERTPKEMVVNILAAKPGFIIGRNGQGLDVIRKEIERNILQFKLRVKLNIQALKQPALSAKVVGESMALEIEKRMPFRRVMKKSIDRVMTAGGQGVKILMSGRLNGVEIARRETLSSGKMSLITMRSDVDYALVEAQTIYGKIGIKTWIYKGELFGRKEKFDKEEDKK